YASGVLGKVVGQDPGRLDARRQLVDLALRTGRYDDAVPHLEALRLAVPDDGRVLFQLGQCKEAKGEQEKAVQLYGEALKRSPTLPSVYPQFARLLLRLNQQAEADRLMDRLVTSHQGAPEALLARANYYYQRATTSQHDKEVKQSLGQATEDVKQSLI